MIVLWTKNAINSTRILDEVRYAKKKYKRIIFLAEKGTKVPDTLVGTNEYIKADKEITEADLVKLVNWIHDIYRLGKL